MAAYANDPLLAFRHALAASVQPIITTSPTPASENTTADLAIATHLHFPAPVSQTYALSTPTRFVSAAAGAQTPIDLRSIYFAWLKRDVAIPEYIAEAQQINEALAVNGTTDSTGLTSSTGEKLDRPAAVVNLVFVERLSLITWLEGLSDEAEKEYIKPVGGAVVPAPSESFNTADHTVDGAGLGTAGMDADAAVRDVGPVDGKSAKVVDPALQAIYDGERKMGDRNSVLRGIRPTVSIFHFLLLVKRIKKLIIMPGLFTPSQNLRNIPFPQQTPKPTNFFLETRVSPTPIHGELHAQVKIGLNLLAPCLPHHLSLPLRLISPSHDKHQSLPRKRRLRAPRPPILCHADCE